MIQERTIETLDRDPAARQELDRDFLHSGYRRKVYVAESPDFRWRGRPRRSRQPITLVPIPIGEATRTRLRFWADGRLRDVELAAGRYYYIPPDLAYQIEVEGTGVLEMFTPIPGNGRVLDEEILAEDYFETLTAEAATSVADQPTEPQTREEQ